MDPDVIIREFTDNAFVTEANDLDIVVLQSNATAEFVSMLANNFKKSMNTNVQYTTYNLNPTDTAIVAGKVLWDASSGMLAVGRDDGLSVMRLNEGVQTPVKFTESVYIGTPVYLISQDGDFPTVGKALGSDVAKNKVIGFASENCAINTVGHMCSVGTIRNVASSVFVTGQVLSAGDKLYLSSGGKLTNSRPSSGENRYVVAVVLSTSNNAILCNATYAEDYALIDDVHELAGAGRTDETVKGNAEDIATLNGDDSTEGSVEKTVKDAVEPIDATLGTLKETVLTAKLAVNELERQAQIGNGATLDFSDIGIVPLDARATGRANPTVEGLTVANMSKESKSFISTIYRELRSWYQLTQGHNYYISIARNPISGTDNNASGRLRFDERVGDSESNDFWIFSPLFGSWERSVVFNHSLPSGSYQLSVYGPQSPSTGTECVWSNFIFLDLTSIFGAGNEPSASDCAKIFSYFDGTKSIPMPARVRSVGKNLWREGIVKKGQSALQGYGGTDATYNEYDDSLTIDSIHSAIANTLFIPDGDYKLSFLIDKPTDYKVVLYVTTEVSTFPAIAINTFSGVRASFSFAGITGFVKIALGLLSADLAPLRIYDIQLERSTVDTPYEPYKDSTLYIADNEEVCSLPNGVKDEIKVVNGQLVKVRNVQRYVLKASDFSSLNTTGTNTDYIVMPLSVLPYAIKTKSAGVVEGKARVIGMFEVGARLDDITKIGGFYHGSSSISFVVAKGTYASITEAQTDLAGTVIYYQLATPIITPLLTSGILQAKLNGTVYYEPYYEGSHQTDASSQITLPYEGTIEAVYGYDEDLVEYLLDSSEYSLTGTTLTITDALENEVYYVELSRSEPLAPEMSVNVINNAEVAEDSVTGKFYQKTFTVANGIPTFGIEEVL